MNRRKLKSKLKDEFSIVSTATEIQGQEMMMIMKHVNLSPGRQRSTTRTKGTRLRSGEHHSSTMRNTPQRKAAASQSRSIQEPMQMTSRGKQMVWPSGENNDPL